MKNIRANAEMLASLGLEQAADLSEKRVQAMSQSTRKPQDKEQRPQKQLRATVRKSAQPANTRSLRSTRSRRPVVVEESDDGDEQDVGSSPSFSASDVEHDPFAQSPYDHYLLVKGTGSTFIALSVYVADVLLTGAEEKQINNHRS